ncbi:Protein kinase [Gracilaria domingensis]|nr:Protein kinase [Gracilaria domingensis]
MACDISPAFTASHQQVWHQSTPSTPPVSPPLHADHRHSSGAVVPDGTVLSHLNVHSSQQEEQFSDHSGTISLFEAHQTPKPSTKARTGFNHHDFKDSDDEFDRQSASRSSRSLTLQSNSSQQPLPIAAREVVYRIIDSIPAAFFFITLSAIDYGTASASVFTQSHSYFRFYHVLDWITAVAFFIDVNARLYSYGFWFYVHGFIRSFEYLLSVINFAFVIAYVLTGAHWLLITRYIRVLRLLTTSLRLRERHLKWRTRLELESLAQVLESERSEHSKLIKWRIDSSAIAIGEQAGHGGFGTVYSGLFRGTLVAVKQICPLERHTTVDCIDDEAITLVNLRHPNVVLFMGFVNEPSKLWIVTEYCSRGSVRDRLDEGDAALTEGRILKLALGAARGLAYLHGQQPPVLHLDLKTSNILISSGWDAKLGDFGLSRSIDNIENNWFYGTMQYAAPEILEANKFTTAADVYSFGICLWEMATKEIPYEHMDPPAVLWGVVKSNLRPPLNKLVCSTKLSVTTGASATRKSVSPVARDLRTPCSPPSPAFAKRGSYATSTITPNTTPVIRPLKSCEGVAASGVHNSLAHTVLPMNVQETLITNTANAMANRAVPAMAPIVPPVRVKQMIRDLERKENKDVMFSSGTFPEISEEQDSAVRKGSTRRRVQRGARGEQNTSGLNSLTTKVTATIQMFDDRPPIIRRKEDEGSVDALLETCGSVGDANSVIGSPRFQSMRRQNIIPKSIGKAINMTSRKVNQNTTAEDSSTADTDEGEIDPFMRRLANFSRRTDDANKYKVDQANVRDENDNNVVMGTEGCAAGAANCGRKVAKVPQEYIDLIQKCWSPNAEDRPTASELVWQLVIMMDCQMREK